MCHQEMGIIKAPALQSLKTPVWKQHHIFLGRTDSISSPGITCQNTVTFTVRMKLEHPPSRQIKHVKNISEWRKLRMGKERNGWKASPNNKQNKNKEIKSSLKDLSRSEYTHIITTHFREGIQPAPLKLPLCHFSLLQM